MTPTPGLARNSVYNVLGQGLPLLVAVLAIPVVVRGLGDARFGLLGLLWMFISLLADMGFGRAGTRFMARRRGVPDGGGTVRRIVRVTLGAQIALGAVFAAVLGVLAGPLGGGILEMDPALRSEATASFLILAAAAPVLTVGAAFRGFLEADQRFGPLNVIRGTGSALTYLLPAGAVWLGWGLPAIMALLLALRALVTVAFGWAGRDLWAPLARGPGAAEGPGTAEVLGFGAWTTVSTVVSPVLVYLDRFLLGALVGVAAVGVYTAPYELATRVLLLPGSLAAVLFPALSTLHGRGHYAELRRVSRRSTLAILAVMAPLAVGFIVLAGPGLRLWLGPAATPEAVRALQVLAPGVLFNALALVPFSALQGLGRADVTGKLHLIELPIHALVAWWMVAQWGVVGAAGSWTLRTTLDAGLLHLAAARLAPRGGT